jgi:hypothetical protein
VHQDQQGGAEKDYPNEEEHEDDPDRNACKAQSPTQILHAASLAPHPG